MSNQDNPKGSTVRQMKVSPMLSKILSEALLTAKEYNHQFLTPEHVLIIAIHNEFVENLLANSGAATKNLHDDVADYIQTKLPVISKEANSDLISGPVESSGFQAMMNRAVFHCVTSNSNVIDITDVLLSMFDEKQNYCSFFLRTNGVDRLKLLENISKVSPAKKTQPQNQNQNQNGFPPDPFAQNNSGGLKRFTTNMTEAAAKGLYDELVGRDEEIERTIQVLCRRSKNNPMHVGDAGVGKTAITQGLAQKIIKNQVPENLKGCTIYSLDLGLLLAGAKFRGDFEERLHSVIDELKKQKKAILFIDEIHMIMGAGNSGNSQMDAANLLKPALASGEVKIIGSTTYEEYSKNFEKDRALARRFQKIDIQEPTPHETVEILKGLLPKYEKYHNVKYSAGVIEEAVKLSVQFMPERRLPDKAIDLIDEVGAYQSIIKNGGFKGLKTSRKSGAAKKNSSLELPDNADKSVKAFEPPVLARVSVDSLRLVTSKITKVPVESVKNNEKEALKNIGEVLENDIFGQSEAVLLAAKAVKRARAGFRNPEKPEACFLFVGPTGCGKTELAKSLSKILKEPLLRYDMSEYQEKHTVSRLVGSPPGYVGFEEGGLLVKDVRKSPRSIVLFDEIEKAHEDIYNVLLQVMDYGQLTDNQGRKADFRSCIIIMTSNAGARDLERQEIGFGNANRNDIQLSINEAVNKEFSPEFRNRLDAVIPFNYLDISVAEKVCQKEIANLAARMKDKKVFLSATDSCISYLTKKGYSKEFGARNIARTVENEIADRLVDEVLFGTLEKGGYVTADCRDDEIIFNFAEF